MEDETVAKIVKGYKIEGGFRVQSINLGDRRKATSSVFAKIVEDIDMSKANGYAFIGNFLNTHKEMDLPNGTLLLVVRGEGSWNHPRSQAYLIQIKNSKPVVLISENWKNKLTIRDKAKEIIDELKGVDVKLAEAKRLIIKAIELVGKEKVLEIIEKEVT
ncbi:hypothetical protein Ferp_0547 [Ferroglobus placidus DSM 10642]|uniref:Uncharacterized protein n=1 Tax=Ferroglobus placidus (strain DSM 10642 / AEDII12DO) TaxID=589924 RepID=D3S387_FERPA|nr:hypothetical protein [Ferroglobus placidus]ADC64720.1 hypothetical protein Ferp_0547 [Ferroglobus placidus DSM 10642]